MARFRFRLQQVLSWQQTQCSLEEARTGEISRELAALKLKTEELSRARDAAERQIFAMPAISPADLEALAAYRDWVRQDQSRIAKAVAESEVRLAAQRQRWTQALRRCRLLENLESRRRAEHEYEANRQLEALASELFLARWDHCESGQPDLADGIARS